MKIIGRTAGHTALLGAVLSISLAASANAQSGDAERLLKGMADYVAGQKSMSISYDSDIEVITSTLQKIQFTSSGQVQMSRPDKLRATRTGGYRDIEVVFDGKLVTVSDKDTKNYARSRPPGRPINSSTCCANSTASWLPARTCCFRTPLT